MVATGTGIATGRVAAVAAGA
ncbi:MAG: hypothetical protein QOI83_3753, partial [Streptomycetaceae bacterium]|nr:hypothetical protein [Streptomycetaceae bacterium]